MIGAELGHCDQRIRDVATSGHRDSSNSLLKPALAPIVSTERHGNFSEMMPSMRKPFQPRQSFPNVHHGFLTVGLPGQQHGRIPGTPQPNSPAVRDHKTAAFLETKSADLKTVLKAFVMVILPPIAKPTVQFTWPTRAFNFPTENKTTSLWRLVVEKTDS
jgi:hypothetical protein